MSRENLPAICAAPATREGEPPGEPSFDLPTWLGRSLALPASRIPTLALSTTGFPLHPALTKGGQISFPGTASRPGQ
jgi:hypothetical protein